MTIEANSETKFDSKLPIATAAFNTALVIAIDALSSYFFKLNKYSLKFLHESKSLNDTAYGC